MLNYCPSEYTSQDNRRGTRPYLVHFRFCKCLTRHAIGWLPGGHLQSLQRLHRLPHHLGPSVPTVMRPPPPTGLPWRPLMARLALTAGVVSVDWAINRNLRGEDWAICTHRMKEFLHPFNPCLLSISTVSSSIPANGDSRNRGAMLSVHHRPPHPAILILPPSRSLRSTARLGGSRWGSGH